jgi:hypothetical protein
MFKPAEWILRTLHKDPETDRVRTIKPGDECQTMWDSICSGNARAWQWCPQTGEIVEGLSETYKYTEADKLEDEILFPGENAKDSRDNRFRLHKSQMDMFENKPSLDIRRFAGDVDTEDDLTDEDSEEYSTDDEDWEERSDIRDDSSDAKIPEKSDPDHDHDHVHPPLERKIPIPPEHEMDEAINALCDQFRSMEKARKGEPDYFVPIVKDPSKAWQMAPSIKEHPPNLMRTLRSSLTRLRVYENSNEAMREDYMRFIDREKSKSMFLRTRLEGF